MSHRATNWAIQQRGLKPATRIVLWLLADRHNPDYGCFPSQALLAHDAEMSRSSVNNHLKKLEEVGLIRRVRRKDPETQEQLSTRYILAFEDAFTQDADEPCPKSGQGSVSKNDPDPCPKNGQSRVQNLDTNPVREPLKNLARARAREGSRALTRNVDDGELREFAKWIKGGGHDFGALTIRELHLIGEMLERAHAGGLIKEDDRDTLDGQLINALEKKRAVA